MSWFDYWTFWSHTYVTPLFLLWSYFCNDVGLYFICVSDDGKLSFDEFNAYFADGILTTEELQELFYSIDGRQNKWVFLFEMGSDFNPSWWKMTNVYGFFFHFYKCLCPHSLKAAAEKPEQQVFGA